MAAAVVQRSMSYHWIRAMAEAFVAAILVVACSAEHQPLPKTPTETVAPRSPSPEPGRSPSVAPPTPSTPTPSPGGPPGRHSYSRGELVEERQGLLILDPGTGGGVVWTFPDGAIGRLSRGGRYITWTAGFLLDTATGATKSLTWDGVPVEVVGLQPISEERFVGVAGQRVGIFRSSTAELLIELPPPPSGVSGAVVTEVEWAPDGRGGVAVGRASPGVATELFTDVVDNATVVRLLGVGGAMQWARSGGRLAVSGASGSLIYNLDTGRRLALPSGGWNPRWSPDDRYVALARADSLDGIRIFDTGTGDEVLRVSGYSVCVGDYWYADGTIAGGRDRSVSVPGGEIVSRDPSTSRPDASGGPPKRYAGTFVGGVVRLEEGGVILAELRVAETVYPSYFYDSDGVWETTTDGRGVLRLGIGGKDLCIPGGSPQGVEKPPFRD